MNSSVLLFVMGVAAVLACGFDGQTFRAVGDWPQDVGAPVAWDPKENRGIMKRGNGCEYSVTIRGLRPGKTYFWKVTINAERTGWANNWGCQGNNNPPACQTAADGSGALKFTIVADGNPFRLSTSSPGGGGNNNPPPQGGGNSKKLGLAWGDWDKSDMGQLAGNGKKPTWFYTWSAWSIRQDTHGLEWVPMFHLPSQIGEWQQAKNTAGYYDRSSHALFINEPDLNGVSVGQAVDLWRREFQPLKSKGKRLGGPAVVSNDGGTNWQQQFMSQCQGCSIDFIPLHWYGARPQDFINYVTMMHNKFNKPIWITEFGCATWGGGSCSDNDIRNLMARASEFLDSQPWVERYSWFASMSTDGIPHDGALAHNNALLGPGGKSRTFMGEQYIRGGR